jgi:hypothetical protein
MHSTHYGDAPRRPKRAPPTGKVLLTATVRGKWDRAGGEGGVGAHINIPSRFHMHRGAHISIASRCHIHQGVTRGAAQEGSQG